MNLKTKLKAHHNTKWHPLRTISRATVSQKAPKKIRNLQIQIVTKTIFPDKKSKAVKERARKRAKMRKRTKYQWENRTKFQ
jgi:hypothetical protein